MFPVFISMSHSLLNFINEPTWGRRCVRKLTELHRAFPFPSSFSGSVTQAQHSALSCFPSVCPEEKKDCKSILSGVKGRRKHTGWVTRWCCILHV